MTYIEEELKALDEKFYENQLKLGYKNVNEAHEIYKEWLVSSLTSLIDKIDKDVEVMQSIAIVDQGDIFEENLISKEQVKSLLKTYKE